MAFTSHPSAGQNVASSEFSEHMEKRDELQPRIHEGFDFSASGLTATIDPGVAFIRGKDVGDLADDPETAVLAPSDTNWIFLLRTGALSVNQTGTAPADSILLWEVETDSTDVIGTPVDHRVGYYPVNFDAEVRAQRFFVDETTPVDSDELVSKIYVDEQVGLGGVLKQVRVAATAALTLATDVEAGDTLDGVTLVAGDVILLTAQAAGAENGPWVVAASGAPTRPTYFDSSLEANNLRGALFSAQAGTANSKRVFKHTTTATITLGTTALVFEDAAVFAHAATTTVGVHGSATAATPSTLVHRDSNGRSSFADGVADGNAVNLKQAHLIALLSHQLYQV